MENSVFEDLSELLTDRQETIEALNHKFYNRALQVQEKLSGLIELIEADYDKVQLSEGARDAYRMLATQRELAHFSPEKKKEIYKDFSGYCQANTTGSDFRTDFLRTADDIHNLKSSCLRMIKKYHGEEGENLPKEIVSLTDKMNKTSDLVASASCWGMVALSLKTELERLIDHYPGAMPKAIAESKSVRMRVRPKVKNPGLTPS